MERMAKWHFGDDPTVWDRLVADSLSCVGLVEL